MSIIAPATRDILKPFTNIDNDERSQLENCKAEQNLWCDTQND